MTRRLTGIIVLVAGLVLGTAALMSGAISEGETAARVVRSFSLEPGQELRVVGWNGPITYETWDRDVVQIEAVAEPWGVVQAVWRMLGGEANVNFTEDERGVAVRVDASGGMLGRASLRIGFHIWVPEDWSGTVVLNTTNGRIEARGLAGDATLKTSNGAIWVDGVSGALDARTSNGAIRLADVDASVTAVTSNGTVRVLGGTLRSTGRVQTSNGGVELRVGLSRDAFYDVTTSNGTVTAVLAEPDVSLDLTTFNGEVRLQTEVTVSTIGQRRLVGRIGEGNAFLKIRTTNGSIILGRL